MGGCGNVFDSIKDRVKTLVLRGCFITSYVPLRFYPSESVSCWNKYIAAAAHVKYGNAPLNSYFHEVAIACSKIKRYNFPKSKIKKRGDYNE